jgi:nitrite reductase/ring-hydroxylating ferredoxin subunit
MNDIVLGIGRRLAALAKANRFDSVENAVEVDTSRYIATDRWEQEKTLIFDREPQLVGLSADVPEPGCYWAFEMAGKPVFIVRGEDKILRGFVNACRHRGAALVQGRGQGSHRLACPYHGWAYDSKGNLAGIPQRQFFSNCDLTSRNLIELPVAEKYGLIVMSPHPDVPADVDARLGPIAAEILPFEISSAYFVQARAEEFPVNWKLVNEASIEGYHLQPLHGASMDKLMGKGMLLRHTTYDEFAPHGRMCTGMRPLVDSELTSSTDAAPYITLTNFVFPTTVFEFNVGGITIARHEPGSGPNKMIYSIQTYAWTAPENDEALKAQHAMFNMTWFFAIDEDIAVLKSVQRALDAGFPETVLHGGVEPGVQNVNRAWDEALARAKR